ncbi:MAG: SAP domain-containing protein [Candidatus Caldatribacteriota bacterium]|jgi:uncharacterized protein CbrC (UPF0167 family)
MKIKFIKDIGDYKAGDVADLEHLQAKAYMECKKATLFIGEVPENNIANMPYKELRKLCKSKGLPAVGSKETMISLLTDKK